MRTRRLEASTTQAILTQLANLGWEVDERKPNCNVFQQRGKTEDQRLRLKGKKPDFVLYQTGTNTPLGIIEAKKSDQSLTQALNQAEQLYARPLGVPLIFAYNDTYVATRYLSKHRPLKIDGEDVRQFVDHYTALRFVKEGPEILSAPEHIQYSRDQLINTFRAASNLLREAGLQAGLERFGAFSDILFLKIMDEMCELKLHASEKSPLPPHIRWSHFRDLPAPELHDYMKGVVWKAMNERYGSIFSESLPIDSPEILREIVDGLSELNLTAADTDIKGDAFEYFLKNAYQGLSIKDLGEYFTPRNIVRTMVSMVDPQIGEKIYDPFCGTGGFLIESYKYLNLRMKPITKLEEILKRHTVYGSEITTNARIAKMNMILFGDGHSNIRKEDSFANPKPARFDIVVTNPPYSQQTRYGNLYPVDSSNGDAIAVLHCFESLNAHGRAAILVKENFLSDGGDIGRAREYIIANARNFSVISLPRKLFVPYTPTKTSVIYFEKAGKRKTTFFYVVKGVGHTLAARKKSIEQNDLVPMLDSFNDEQKSTGIESCVVGSDDVKANSYSLWVYDYLEVVPPSEYRMEPLGKFIEEMSAKVIPADFPDQDFSILGVSNKHGVFENEVLPGEEIRQKYKQVRKGDLVYNPHRVNVGSIGLVPPECDGGYVSGIYIVFRPTDPRIPPEYILSLLKSEAYRKVIEAYDTKYGAVRANLTYEQLCRVRVPILSASRLAKFMDQLSELSRIETELRKKRVATAEYLETIVKN